MLCHHYHQWNNKKRKQKKMNARERVLKAINHEEPDRVPLFCQIIMPEFQKRIIEYWGEDFKKDRKLKFYLRDYNIEKKLGFDCSWGATLLPLTLPANYLREHPTPTLDDPNRFVDFDGRIQQKADPNSPVSDIAWYKILKKCHYSSTRVSPDKKSGV